jgi:hypothetical protein
VFALGWGLALGLPLRGAGVEEQSGRAKQLALYQEQHRKLNEAYFAKLEQLADAAEQAGFAEDAKAIRSLTVELDPAKIEAQSLPQKVQPELPIGLPPEEAWRLKLREVREEQANDLYRLSRLLLNAGFPSAAYRLVREVTLANPDHTYARKILGYQRLGEEWITPFEAEQSKKRMVWHEQFGWLQKTFVDRYENGERYFNGRWMPAAQEEAVRQAFQNAWEIRTEHFLVQTNHNLERGVEVAKKLEEYHDFFTQTFPGFFHTPDQLNRLFGDAAQSRRPKQQKPFLVHYYRTREEYIQTLVQKVPQVAITNGLYHNGDRVAYFYHDPKENNDSTLFHEATHQIFYETRFDNPRTAQGVGEAANFWIIEGIACYMESLKTQNGQQTLGDPAFVRFYWARNRFLREGYYVPLAQFAAMGMRQFQNQSEEDLSRNYSQSSGLVHFFMHYEGGLYRDALIEHLSQIYEPGKRFTPPQSLAELTGVPFAELDQQYKDYLRAQQQALNAQSRLNRPAHGERGASAP